jgi:hypothetical protein
MPLPTMPTRHPDSDPRAGTGDDYDPQRGGWYPQPQAAEPPD